MATEKKQKKKSGNKHASNTKRMTRKYGRLDSARREPAKAGKRKVYGVQERWNGRRVRAHANPVYVLSQHLGVGRASSVHAVGL